MRHPLSAFALALAFAFTLALPAVTQAQQQGMSADLHKQAQEVSELMQAGNNTEAATRLSSLRARKGLSNYEKAILAQLHGYALAGNGDYGPAVKAFEDSLAQEALPPEISGQVSVALVHMYIETGAREQAGALIEKLTASGYQGNADFFNIAAYVYLEMKDYARAENYALQAIAAEEKPRENSYQILLSVYRAQKAWSKAEGVLHDVLERFPGEYNYWQFLSYALFEQGKENEAVAALMLAYRLGVVPPGELERIATMHANIGTPQKAALLLEKWMNDGSMEANAERLTLTGKLWLVARERDKAKLALAKAAEASPTPEIDLMLGKLYYDDENWEPAIKYLQAALTKNESQAADDKAEKVEKVGGRKKPSREEARAETELLLGVCAYNAGQKHTARSALEAAGKTEKYHKHAQYWLTRLQESEKNADLIQASSTPTPGN